MNIEELIKKLETKKEEIKAKLEKRRLDMGDQDGPNVSRYITATRWLVEQEIESMDKELVRLNDGIKEIKKLSGDKRRISEKYFVAENFEYIEFGIISQDSKVGKEILEANA